MFAVGGFVDIPRATRRVHLRPGHTLASIRKRRLRLHPRSFVGWTSSAQGLRRPNDDYWPGLDASWPSIQQLWRRLRSGLRQLHRRRRSIRSGDARSRGWTPSPSTPRAPSSGRLARTPVVARLAERISDSRWLARSLPDRSCLGSGVVQHVDTFPSSSSMCHVDASVTSRRWSPVVRCVQTLYGGTGMAVLTMIRSWALCLVGRPCDPRVAPARSRLRAIELSRPATNRGLGRHQARQHEEPDQPLAQGRCSSRRPHHRKLRRNHRRRRNRLFRDDDHPSERACTEAHRKGRIDDVNEDGKPDLLLHFRLSQTGIDPGDTLACLTGSACRCQRRGLRLDHDGLQTSLAVWDTPAPTRTGLIGKPHRSTADADGPGRSRTSARGFEVHRSIR